MLVPKLLGSGCFSVVLLLSGIEGVRADTSSVDLLDGTQSECMNDSTTLEYWRNVRENASTNITPLEANTLVPLLAECLKSKNPELRDRIAYEVLTFWMRKNVLTKSSVADLADKLMPWLAKESVTHGDDSAIARAFSALVLSEVVRFDALTPFMGQRQLSGLTVAAIAMFVKERDYRGLTDELGWIHTIAHGADLLWRLSLHPNLTKEQQSRILEALASQIVGADIPAYTFNEFDRLARVVTVLMSRGDVGDDDFVNWISELSKPGDLGTWGNAFSSPSGMAQLHNRKQFLRALTLSLGDAQSEEIDQALQAALNALP